MMSEYYDEESLINVLKYHLLPEDKDKIDWKRVIDDGEIYPHPMKEVDGCYIYQIDTPTHGSIVIFVHPTICIEIHYDAWTDKDIYMGRAEGEIW